MSSRSWPSAAWSSLTRASDAGAASSARASRTNRGDADQGRATNGIWTRSCPHPGQGTLPLASGRSGRDRARRFGAESAQHEGGQAVLSQVAEGSTVRSQGDRDGHARQLQRGQARGLAPCRAPPRPLPQRPGGELASPDAASLGIALRRRCPGGTDRFAIATRCGGSSRPATPGGSCPRTGRSPATSVHDATAWPPATTA